MRLHNNRILVIAPNYPIYKTYCQKHRVDPRRLEYISPEKIDMVVHYTKSIIIILMGDEISQYDYQFGELLPLWSRRCLIHFAFL